MDSKEKIKSIISRILIVAMMFTLLPGNVWAESQRIHNEKTGRYSQASSGTDRNRANSTPSEATPPEATPPEATPPEATPPEATPPEATPSVTDPVPYVEISLDGRSFSMIASVGQAPYYQVLKYTVPEHEGGYYTFYSEKLEENPYYGVDPFGYLGNSEQYEALCHQIEAYQRSFWPSVGSQCLAYDDDGGIGRNFMITYELEGGQDYYFIATRYWNYSDDDSFKIVVMRDIEINLDDQGADYSSTSKLYSRGSYWSVDSDRYDHTTYIWEPHKNGYIFGGYFTEREGQGTKVIDLYGDILDELNELSDHDTIYAHWEEFPRFKSDRFKDGIKDTAYMAKLETTSSLPFRWFIYEGELPAGLSLDWNTGVISGVPTELGTSSFTIIAINYQKRIGCYAETSITIKTGYDSSDYEDQPGNWHLSSDGNWRYYTSGNRYYSNEWKQVEYNGELGWYHFGRDGYIDTGWFVDRDGRWYYLNPVSDGTKGKMLTGWLTDPQDGNRYYLEPLTGQMVTGWVCIDEVWYYFNENGADNSGWKWDEETGRWIYESLGKQTLGMLLITEH